MANAFVVGIIGLTIAVILIANVFMPTLKGSNTTSFSASELAMWGVIGLFTIIGLAYGAGQIFGLV